MILVTGRTARQGTGLEIGKTSEYYFENVAVAFFTRSDMKRLDLKSGNCVELKTIHGSVVLRCKDWKWGEEGIVFVPYGPWSNLVSGSDTQGTGMPDYKGIEVEIRKTKKPVMSLTEIAAMLGEES